MKASITTALVLVAAARLFAADPVPLFDGKTLNGWTNYEGKAPGPGWVIQDGGVLHLNGTNGPKGGNLLSNKEYSNFELEWDWKLESGGNNGVKYWVTKINNKEWLGIEYQMIDDAKHPDGLKGGSHTTASIYDIKAPSADKPLKPIGEWNSSKVIAKDGKIQHYLNGALVSEADTNTPEWKEMIALSKFKSKPGFAPGKGRIMLTDHGDKAWFKNIRIKEL
ncbi:MAG TPA: DUF1080 domain-containing protein [Prosthecobacter sp.]|nr:DUF1080 domain-containing protein [Prosthecobacter sp.]